MHCNMWLEAPALAAAFGHGLGNHALRVGCESLIQWCCAGGNYCEYCTIEPANLGFVVAVVIEALHHVHNAGARILAVLVLLKLLNDQSACQPHDRLCHSSGVDECHNSSDAG